MKRGKKKEKKRRKGKGLKIKDKLKLLCKINRGQNKERMGV
jgi:hypothetical protein